MLNSKLIGGILLIVGTSIGGGMLALPVATAKVGFGNSLIFLFMCWLIMTAGALLILEVNLRLPSGSNLSSMAKFTLGLPGQIVAWVTNLLLFYTLLAAYISGGSDVFNALLAKGHINVPNWLTSLLFTLLFSLVVYNGIRSVDMVNRGLMFGKLGVYVLLIAIISPHVSILRLEGGSILAIQETLMILITSFGFASIVPSLRQYFNNDIKTLRKVILFGSLIPLICYMLWDAVIMGVISRDGGNGLINLMNSNHTTSELTAHLNYATHSPWINVFFSFFTSICMITAFLGVSLGLFDFLADGLKFKKSGYLGISTLGLTFLPPLVIVLVKPGIYLHALNYAGTCCVVLLLILPTLMAWQGRKNSGLNSKESHMIPGGNFSLMVIGIAALGLLAIAIIK